MALPAPPRRIVSLVPSVTEWLFALGAGDRLVGRTDYCDYPPEATRRPSVGGMVAPNLEAIVALRPDLVIATDAGSRWETFAALTALGVAVYLVHASRLADVADLVRRLGALTEREDAVGPLLARFDGRVEAVRRGVAGRRRPRVLYVLWPEPLIVPGREALVTELIDVAGGDSITRDEPGDYPRFSLEAAVARAPEVIVLARHGTGSGPVDRTRWERFGSLPAVRDGRVHGVDGDLLHRYGPRVVDGLQVLARLLHPEVGW
ncbi:MAG TPA: cobalamin-binding protein [Calidithermus sp.]|nr:cobalamin-binding protein [Calidithermus sp.]